MKVEIRKNQVVLAGYVNVTGRPSEILTHPHRGKFVEIIVPGTFEKALLLADNVDLIFNHNKNRKLGSIKQGNLELFEDGIGLRIKCTVTDSEVIKQAKQGNLSGWSFDFTPYRDEWVPGGSGIPRRFIRDLSLKAISLLGVGMKPAYKGSSVEARSMSFNALEIYEKQMEILKLKGGKTQ